MTIPENAIYLKDSLNSRPETVEAVFWAVQQLIEALRAGKWPESLIIGDLRDPSGELIPATRNRFLHCEEFEVAGMYETDGFYAVDSHARVDGKSVRVGMVFCSDGDGVIKLKATPIIGSATPSS